MSGCWTRVSWDADDMPHVHVVPLPDARRGSGWSPRRDYSEQAYEQRWLENFRKLWRRALGHERQSFRRRLEEASDGAHA